MIVTIVRTFVCRTYWSSCDSVLILRAGKEISRHLVCFIKPKFKILRSILASFLLFWALFVPLQSVEAGLLSSLFGVGDQADAKTDASSSSNIVNPPRPSSNSQTLALLQANVSSATVLQDNKDAKDNKKDSSIDTKADVN